MRQRQAIAAFQGGCISLAKLAKEMGLHVLQLPAWLAERGLEQQTAYADTDADHA